LIGKSGVGRSEGAFTAAAVATLLGRTALIPMEAMDLVLLPQPQSSVAK